MSVNIRINELLKLMGINDTAKRAQATHLLEQIIIDISHKQDVAYHSDGPTFAQQQQ